MNHPGPPPPRPSPHLGQWRGAGGAGAGWGEPSRSHYPGTRPGVRTSAPDLQAPLRPRRPGILPRTLLRGPRAGPSCPPAPAAPRWLLLRWRAGASPADPSPDTQEARPRPGSPLFPRRAPPPPASRGGGSGAAPGPARGRPGFRPSGPLPSRALFLPCFSLWTPRGAGRRRRSRPGAAQVSVGAGPGGARSGRGSGGGGGRPGRTQLGSAVRAAGCPASGGDEAAPPPASPHPPWGAPARPLGPGRPGEAPAPRAWPGREAAWVGAGCVWGARFGSGRSPSPGNGARPPWQLRVGAKGCGRAAPGPGRGGD